jgi:hypothetical protein
MLVARLENKDAKLMGPIFVNKNKLVIMLVMLESSNFSVHQSIPYILSRARIWRKQTFSLLFKALNKNRTQKEI